MIRLFKRSAWALCCLALSAFAADDAAPDATAQLPDAAAQLPDAAAQLRERLNALGFELEIESIAESPLDGLFEVELEGGEYLYASTDGRYLLSGSLYEFHDGGLVSLTEQKRNAKRRELFAGVPVSETVAFAPEDGTRASVMVFTDIDCGFCRRLHAQLPDYLSRGIEVRYLAYPRAGIGSSTYDRMVSAWCADDSLGALTALKQGEEIPARSCVNPVAEQYELGRKAGLTGTPSFVLPNGQMLSGLMEAEQLAELLGI